MDIFEIEKTLFFLYHRKESVTFDEIPVELQNDFKKFIIGQTLMNKNGVPHVPYLVFYEWFYKVVFRVGITA